MTPCAAALYLKTMERDIKSLAVVVRSGKKGERDRSLTLFSPSLGLLDATVYGAQKSPKALQIPLYSEGNFSIYHMGGPGRYSLKDADIIADRHAILEDIDLSVAASLFSELVMLAKNTDAELYRLYVDSLDELSSGTGHKRVVIAFIIHFLNFFGILGGFDFCPVCQRDYQENEVLGYNSKDGVVCCQACDDFSRALILPPNARRFLARTLELSIHDAMRLNISTEQTDRVFSYVLRLLKTVFPSRIRTLETGLWNLV